MNKIIDYSLLNKLIGKSLNNIYKIIWNSSPFEEIPSLYDIEFKEIFQKLDSPVLLQFTENIIVSFYPNVEAVSVDFNFENQDGISKLLHNSDVSLIISINNTFFSDKKFKDALYQKIVRVKLYKRTYQRIGYQTRRRDSGFGLEFQNGKEIIFSRDFLTGNGDFEILFKEEIHPDVLPELEEILIEQ